VLTGLEKGEKVITGPYRTVTKTLNSGKLVNSKNDKESIETTSEEGKEQ
jgi:HlyD family secretion protein